MNKMVWFFEKDGVVLSRGWCGTLNRVVWYFEENEEEVLLKMVV